MTDNVLVWLGSYFYR